MSKYKHDKLSTDDEDLPEELSGTDEESLGSHSGHGSKKLKLIPAV